MFHLICLASFSLICIFLSSIIIVDCHLLIHESNVWIPIFNNSLLTPYFFYTENHFYPTNYSSRVLNTDPNAVGEESSVTRFAPAYSRRPNSFILQSKSSADFAHYDYIPENVFELIAGPFSAGSLNAHRWLSISDSIYAIGMMPGSNITNSRANLFAFVQSNGNSINWTIYGHNPVESTVRSFQILQTFKFKENFYSFGLLTIDLLRPVYFISQISNFLINLEVDRLHRYFYSELHSISFYERYGPIDKVRFVDSFSIMSDGSSFSLITFSYNRNSSDHIEVIPLNSMLNDFEGPAHGCQTAETFWKVDLFNESGPECNSFSQSANIQALSIRKDFTVYHLTGILTVNWTRIIDFVPLALDATPGYVFLVLSSNSDVSRYRYSIHFVNENYSVLPHPIERTFDHRNINNLNRTISQIYYHGFNHPRVIITFNQYSYTDSIILCPLLNNSCIDCFTTKVYNSNGNFLRYCQWTRGNSLSSGECSIGATNSTDSRETTLTNQTVNPCFSPTNIQADYVSGEPTFDLNFDLLGYHSKYSHIFPLTFTLVHNATYSFIESCSVVNYNQSKVYLNCNRVNSGQYRLSILLVRRQGPFQTLELDNLITYSDSFTISSLPLFHVLLRILLICTIIISIIVFFLFYTRRTVARKVLDTLDKIKNPPPKGSLPDIRSKHKSSLDSKSKLVVTPTVHRKSKSVPFLKVHSRELSSKKSKSIDLKVSKSDHTKSKTSVTLKQSKEMRNESLKAKSKR
ncbi:uncharacterized protein LOC128397743 [Panonychus citri]|uniref:uncharacterized protein LOC128397743 n=1 Tax=Panonychus citri TaxID=50023 RepID=UPI002307A72F|nr:uncharacterized protein LOC128397743 [Panonychus citri]